MAARSAMRLLAAAMVVLAVVHSASALDNTFNYGVSVYVKGNAADYLDIKKRQQFCTAFVAVVNATATGHDVTGCSFSSADSTSPVVAGEVKVIAVFTTKTTKTVATDIVAPINDAFAGAGITGFEKGSTVAATNAAAVDTKQYSALVEIASTGVTDDTTLTAKVTSLQGKLDTATTSSVTLTCPGGATALAAVSNAAPTKKGARYNCTLTSKKYTASEMVTTLQTVLTADAASDTYLYLRNTGLESADPLRHTVTLKVVLGGLAKANYVDTDFLAAILAALKPLVADPADVAGSLTVDTNANTAVVGTTDLSSLVTIKVASEADVNLVFERVKSLIGTTIGSGTKTFKIAGVLLESAAPIVFADALTALPGLVSWYTIPIVNSTNNFTDTPSAFNSVCEQIVEALEGNVTKCAIVEFDRLAGKGTAGELTIELTAANGTAALDLGPNVLAAVSTVANYSVGDAEQVAYPGAWTGANLVVTLPGASGTLKTTAQFNSQVRKEICDQLTGNGFVPKDVITCSIASTDVHKGSVTDTVQVTARLWWRIPSFTVDQLAAALTEAVTDKTFTTATTGSNIDYTKEFLTIAPAGTTPPPNLYVIEADFHLSNDSTTLIDDSKAPANVNQELFTNATSAILGGATVAWSRVLPERPLSTPHPAPW